MKTSLRDELYEVYERHIKVSCYVKESNIQIKH